VLSIHKEIMGLVE